MLQSRIQQQLIHQTPALKRKLFDQLAKVFVTISEIAEISGKSIIEQEVLVCDFRTSVRMAYSGFELSLNFPSLA